MTFAKFAGHKATVRHTLYFVHDEGIITREDLENTVYSWREDLQCLVRNLVTEVYVLLFTS